MPPLGFTDMLDYAVYGRIAVLGHSPYQMTPAQLAATGDPVGAAAPVPWRHMPSVYGPVATLSEQAASALAGPSSARTIVWLKVLNGLAYLAVALALDRVLASDTAARTRAHLLWSVNPLMLWAVMAGGHLDGLAAAAGFLGLLCLRRLGAARGLAAGLLVGAAIAMKAPFVLFLPAAGWAARRSPRTLAGTALGVVAVVVPAYLLAGRAAIKALVSRATGGPDLYQPWQLLTRTLAIHPATRFTDTAALAASVLLAVLLLWRLPSGPSGLPFTRPALALSLAWLICTPQQRPWYDAMILPAAGADAGHPARLDRLRPRARGGPGADSRRHLLYRAAPALAGGARRPHLPRAGARGSRAGSCCAGLAVLHWRLDPRWPDGRGRRRSSA